MRNQSGEVGHIVRAPKHHRKEGMFRSGGEKLEGREPGVWESVCETEGD